MIVSRPGIARESNSKVSRTRRKKRFVRELDDCHGCRWYIPHHCNVRCTIKKTAGCRWTSVLLPQGTLAQALISSGSLMTPFAATASVLKRASSVSIAISSAVASPAFTISGIRLRTVAAA
jgi:hypothetical protein